MEPPAAKVLKLKALTTSPATMADRVDESAARTNSRMFGTHVRVAKASNRRSFDFGRTFDLIANQLEMKCCPLRFALNEWVQTALADI
jgi:hypothetical protein